MRRPQVWHETEAEATGEAYNSWMHAPAAWVEKVGFFYS